MSQSPLRRSAQHSERVTECQSTNTYLFVRRNLFLLTFFSIDNVWPHYAVPNEWNEVEWLGIE